MRCGYCGTELPDDALFCHKCGKKAEMAEKQKFCRECGAKLPEGVYFCPLCGSEVSSGKHIKEKTGSKPDDIDESVFQRTSGRYSGSSRQRDADYEPRTDSKSGRKNGKKGNKAITAAIVIPVLSALALGVLLYFNMNSAALNNSSSSPQPAQQISPAAGQYAANDDPGYDPTVDQAETENTGSDTSNAYPETSQTDPSSGKVFTPVSTPMPTPEPTPDPDPVSYSSNTKGTVGNGNSGIYTYKLSEGSYDKYFVISFDDGYVYIFSEENGDGTCDKVPITGGTLNDVLVITYHDGDDVRQYGLHFKWKNQADQLILEDENHVETELYTTDFHEAITFLASKSIRNY